MKIHVKQLILYLIIGGSSLNISYIKGDVFKLQKNTEEELENVVVNNENAFRIFISENKNATPENANDPFTGDASNATQMLGYAVFFPEGNTDSQQVYVAKKRKYVDENTPVTNYENVTSIEDFRNSTNFDHTERQLITKIIDNYGINCKSRGVLCIYTFATPCRDEGPDNNEMCCIDYYKQLAITFSSIKFKVYFTDNGQITTRNYKGDYNFLSAMSRIIQNISLQIKILVGSKEIPLKNTENVNFGRSIWSFTGRSFQTINSELSEQNNPESIFNQLYNPTVLNNLQFHILQ